MGRKILLRQVDGGREILAEIEEDSLGEFSIGRLRSSGLFLDDPGVSRRHARIFVEGGRILIEDVGSSGGTYLNDRELDKSSPLDHGVTFRVGGIEIAVEIQGDGDAQAPADEKEWEPYAPPVEPPRAGDVTMASSSAAKVKALPDGFEISLGDDPITIGRGEECEVVLDSPVISREHARIKPGRAGGWTIKDLGSKNGTFVNGESAERSRKLEQGDTVGIGPYRLALDGSRLIAQSLKAGARIEVVGLVKEVIDRQTKQPRKLLEDVTLTIEPGDFIGLMGPLGCGKSTFMGMINGRELRGGGMVFYDGEDLYQNLDALKAAISYIPQQVDPQQVIVHQDLPVEEALGFTCRLRLPPDTSSAEINANIERVLKTVKLEHKRKVQIKHLSGGQRKKVAVAIELLNRPRVMLLDEVTAGMDLGNEQQTMELFRKLADEGMTVVCITHYVDRLKMCDKVACFGNGRLAFYGAPHELKEHFQVQDLGDVYPLVEEADSDKLAADYQRSEYFERHVSAHQRDSRRTEGRTRRPPTFSNEDRKRQWQVLTSRYVRLLGLDAASSGVLLAMAPLIAWLLCVLGWSLEAPDKPLDTASFMKAATKQNLLCFGSVLTMLFLGLFGSVREIVKESPIFRHERFSNLLILPYLLSKAVPLAMLAFVQALFITLILSDWGGLQASPQWQVILVLWLVGICGTMLGLLISALAVSSDQAVMVMIGVVIPQILFAGAVVAVKGWAGLIGRLTVAYWAHDALKSLLEPNLQRFLTSANGDSRWGLGLLALVVHASAYGIFTFLGMAHKDGEGGIAKALGLRREM